MIKCPGCGEENPPRCRLCGYCGTPLAQAAPLPVHEVRKTVTIIFTDLKDSTALGERLDSEALHEVKERYSGAMAAEIRRHGGKIEKYIGDAIMAVFGLPRAHEDDALRAVRAAIGMQAALQEVNKALQARFAVTLANRTGVNTGEVVALDDPTADQKLATGDAVNVTARLEAAAPANEIYIGETTWRLVRDAVEVEAVEPLTLKGKSQQVAAYRLVKVHGFDGNARRHDAPFVGREHELGVLQEALRTARSERRAQLVTVIADAGMGKTRMVREMSRGEVIGELAMYTGDPRSATVIAVRDSVLVKLDRAHFPQLLATSPAVSIAFTQQIIRRPPTEHQRRRLSAPATIGLLAISEGVDLPAFARNLAAELGRHGKAVVLDTAAMENTLGVPGIATRDDADSARRMAVAIDTLAARHDFVLLQGDAALTPWTKCCLRHGDELFLVADALQPPRLHPLEAPLAERATPSEAAEILVLLQPIAQAAARGTREWLARRPVSGHVHVRREYAADLARLARLISRNAVGLVFGGGGARGFAHLGVWRALRARGVEIDCVGGTSIGAVMAALVAADSTCERAIDIARRAFRNNPTGDYNLLPLVSLIKGQRVRDLIEQALGELTGGAVDIEDLWKTYFCAATNYSQAREHAHLRGDLARALRSSIAIPGALPPVVHDGDLLCDGGTFNNFPVDLMRQQRGVGRVIGVDLGGRNPRRLDFDEVPGSWALLRDRLRPRSARRYRLPSLASYLVNVTILYSISRRKEARAVTDLDFNPPLFKVGLLQWKRFDGILRQGEQHANEVLDGLTSEQRAALGLTG